MSCAGRQQEEGEEEAVGGGVPVRESEEPAPRTEPFEISHNAAERQEGGPLDPSEEEQETARIEADEVVIEEIRRAEVSGF